MTKSATARKAMFCMVLVTIQFGMQPLLTHTFTPKTICKSTVIMVQEMIKFILAMSMLLVNGEFSAAIKGWSIHSWIRVAALPAVLYTVQNTAALTAYQTLDGVTFNVLNQTKTLSAALCCYLIIGRKQSKRQVLALLLLFVSALIVENLIPLNFIMGGNSDNDDEVHDDDDVVHGGGGGGGSSFISSRHFTHGVLPVLIASFISGLAGAISQKNLQNDGRNPYLFSSELCVASILTLSLSLMFTEDGKQVQMNGFFDQWTIQTLIPVFTNAIGGIVVGLVTKYAGSVKKGFALIFGMVLTGVVQSIVEGIPCSKTKVVGGALAAFSLWIHSSGGKRLKKDPRKQD